MSNNITLRKAERKQAKLRIGLFGPSGAGKTMSALKLARGITEWDKICLIDTENRSGDLYSHLGDYNIINIDAPYLPEKYIEAIDAAVAAGMEVIIVDSITHEWAGKGGILELADELADKSKNSFAVWSKLTPRHNAFIDTIVACPVDIICCGRSKQEWVLNQTEKNGKVINVPEKVGLKANTREGFDYEMTVSFEISIKHYATTSKDRTGIFMDKPEFKISEDTGHAIKKWNSEVAPDITQQKLEIKRQLVRLGLPVATADDFKQAVKLNTDLELDEKNYTEIIAKLRVIKAGEAKTPDKPKDDTTPQNPTNGNGTAPAESETNNTVSHETETADAAAPGETPAPAAPEPVAGQGVPPEKQNDPTYQAAHAKKSWDLSEIAAKIKADMEAATDMQALENAHMQYVEAGDKLRSFEKGVINGAYSVAKTRLGKDASGEAN